jgi:hypothetical protein
MHKKLIFWIQIQKIFTKFSKFRSARIETHCMWMVGLLYQCLTQHTVPPIFSLVNFYLNEMTLHDTLLQLLVSQYNRSISFRTL